MMGAAGCACNTATGYVRNTATGGTHTSGVMQKDVEGTM